MSDKQLRVLSATIFAAAGGITFGLGAIAQSLRPGVDAPWWIMGLLMLLVGGGILAAGVLKRLWNAIPVEGKKR